MANNYRSPTLAVGSKTARQGTSASLNIGDCILVGTPPADGCLSMDLYARDVSEAFGRVFPSLSHILLQPGGETAPWIQKQYLRYSGYPKLLRREIRTRKASVVHVLDHSYAHLCRVAEKTIVTCHDIADLKVSSLTFWQSALWKWRISGLRRAARIVAMSENTARDLRELLEIPPEQIVVNYSGVSGRFTPSQAPPEAECARQLRRVRGERFLFLHVGNNTTRKNIPLLLRALSILRRHHPSVTLVKVGDPLASGENAELVEQLNLTGNLIELGRIEDEALVEVYRSVDCMVFPSLYEGFGRPVVEAQACGTPCILARSSSLEEVGGSAALYHDPSSAEDLANCMKEVLERETLRFDLAARGFVNARRFSWDNHAQKLVDIYFDVYAPASIRISS